MVRFASLAVLLSTTCAWCQFSSPVRDVENPDRTAQVSTCSMQWDSANPYVSQSCVLGFSGIKPVIVETLHVSCFANQINGRFLSLQLSTPSLNTYFMMGAAQIFQTSMAQGGDWSGLRLVVPPANPQSAPVLTVGLSRLAAQAGSGGGATCSLTATGHSAP